MTTSFEDVPVFYLQLRDSSSTVAGGSYRWDDMETGKLVHPSGMDFNWSSENGEKPESIVVKAGVKPEWLGSKELATFAVGDGANKRVSQFRITGLVGLPGSQPVLLR